MIVVRVRNLQPSSSNRKLQPKFSCPNRYFTENSCWVPLPWDQCLPRSLLHSGVKQLTVSSKQIEINHKNKTGPNFTLQTVTMHVFDTLVQLNNILQRFGCIPQGVQLWGHDCQQWFVCMQILGTGFKFPFKILHIAL